MCCGSLSGLLSKARRNPAVGRKLGRVVDRRGHARPPRGRPADPGERREKALRRRRSAGALPRLPPDRRARGAGQRDPVHGLRGRPAPPEPPSEVRPEMLFKTAASPPPATSASSSARSSAAAAPPASPAARPWAWASGPRRAPPRRGAAPASPAFVNIPTLPLKKKPMFRRS